MSQEQTIPVVDLGQWRQGDEESRRQFIEDFGAALADLGFVALEGHGISQELFDSSYGVFREFFALPEEVKKHYEFPERGRRRGYTSFGVEHAKDSDKPDLKEFFHVGRELPEDHPMRERIPQNAWPDEIPALRDTILELYERLEACSIDLLGAFSLYLDQEMSFLPDLARNGNTIMRVIHYPVSEGFDEPGVMRAAAHEDINLMTLLPPADESGLELLTREGDWMPVRAIPGQIVVDTGDMMKRITNDRIPATTHRVVNPQGEPTPRYSMPFFVHPHPDATLEVLDSVVEEGESPKYQPIGAEEFLEMRLEETGVS
jgi:isopenicillin N synthase-like dioxygenase